MNYTLLSTATQLPVAAIQCDAIPRQGELVQVGAERFSVTQVVHDWDGIRSAISIYGTPVTDDRFRIYRQKA